MPFQKGNKYGKGRPKGSGAVGIAREWAQKKGWQKLIDFAEGKGHKVGTFDGKIVQIGPDLQLQFEATKLLIAYGVGKPPQQFQLTGEGGDPIKIKLVNYKDE